MLIYDHRFLFCFYTKVQDESWDLDIRDRGEGLLAVGVLGGEGEEGCDPQGDAGRHRLQEEGESNMFSHFWAF